MPVLGQVHRDVCDHSMQGGHCPACVLCTFELMNLFSMTTRLGSAGLGKYLALTLLCPATEPAWRCWCCSPGPEQSPAAALPMQHSSCKPKPGIHQPLHLPQPDSALRASPCRCSPATTAPCAAGLSLRTASPSSLGAARTMPACASGTPKQGPAPPLSRATASMHKVLPVHHTRQRASTHQVLPVHHSRQRAPCTKSCPCITAGRGHQGEAVALLPQPPASPAPCLRSHGLA